MKLLLIRHGEPAEDGGLTEKGKREAELLSNRISLMAGVRFFVSPLQRARETAEIALRKTDRDAELCDWLGEFEIPVTRPDGLSPVPWNWLPEDWLSDPRFLSCDQWHEHEALQKAGVGEAYQKVVTSFDALLEKYGYRRDGSFYRAEHPGTDTLVFFTHFGLSCVLMSHLFNCSPMVLWHSLIMAPSSVTTIVTEEREKGIAVFRAASIGGISHLYVKGEEPSFAGRFPEIFQVEPDN